MEKARKSARILLRHDIVLVPFPFTNLSSSKRRPALVLAAAPAQRDLILAFISSQGIQLAEVGEVLILPSHPEYALTGLRTASKIRTDKLVTLSRSMITRWLGRLGPLLSAAVDRALILTLGINTMPYCEEGRRLERSRLAALHQQSGGASVLADLGLE